MRGFLEDGDKIVCVFNPNEKKKDETLTQEKLQDACESFFNLLKEE